MLKDNYGRPRTLYIDQLKEMTDVDLFEKTKKMIWLSAYANNNPRSDYHWQVDACYDEWTRRNQPNLYRKAYRETVKETTGHDPYPNEDEDEG